MDTINTIVFGGCLVTLLLMLCKAADIIITTLFEIYDNKRRIY